MITALLYNVSVRAITRARVEITLAPNWLGRLLRRRVRVGIAYRDHDRNDELGWWWRATDWGVGRHIESYIEAAPLLLVEDMTVEQLLSDGDAK